MGFHIIDGIGYLLTILVQVYFPPLLVVPEHQGRFYGTWQRGCFVLIIIGCPAIQNNSFILEIQQEASNFYFTSNNKNGIAGLY